MSDTIKEKTKKFLYSDENVKYSFTHDGNILSIQCDHPIFVRQFGGSTTQTSLADFFKIAQKGSPDYPFFQKFSASLQEHFLDFGHDQAKV